MEEESISHINSHLARHLELVEGHTCDPVKFREDSALTREGYKKTKLGWIPEDWRVIRLGEVCSRKGDYGINAAAVEYSSNLPTYLRITDISPEGNFIDIDKKSVDSPQSNNFILEDNDIVFARTGASVGKSYIHKKEDGKLVFAGFLIRFRTVSEVLSPKYLSYYVQTNKYWNWVKVNSMRSGQPGINSQEYCDMPLPIPPYPEQQKIATILFTWDSAIAKQEQLITAKQEFKKGLMQLLLTRKKRFEGFEGEWESKTLNECCSVKGKYGINAAAVPYKTELPRYLRITDIDDSGNYSPEKEVSVDDPTWSEYVLEDGDIVFARTGNTTGKTYLYDSADGELVFAGFLIKFKPDPRKLNPYFLKYFTNSTAYWKWIEVMSVRSGQPGINSNEYGKLNIKLPSLTEQQKIASVLSAADKEIGLLQSELATLRGQKRGLMQRLLTGEVRVKI